MDGDSAQSGYYREIARAFLERRGGAFFLSPKDQAAIAAWEEKRIPLGVVLEGIARTFDGLKARGRATRTVSLAFCDREVESAWGQHRDRTAGRRKAAEAGSQSDKKDKARREIGQALEGPAADDAEVKRLLQEALELMSAARPDEAALERLDAGIEEALWAVATPAERAGAETEARRESRGRKTGGLDESIRRRAVMAARARLRVPHVSIHYY